MWGGEKKKMDLGKYTLVTCEIKGKKFEVIVDPRKALEVKQGQAKPEEALITFDVFIDAQKGTRATEEDLMDIIIKGKINELREKGQEVPKNFEKDLKDKLKEFDEEKLKEEASKQIVKMGILKLPKYLRDELIEKKERQIISYLQKYAINPSTKAPYPPEVLKEALDKVFSGEGTGKARITIDPLKDVNEQLQQIIEALKLVIPIRLESVIAKVTVPARFTGQAYSKIESFGTVKESEWLNDGSLQAVVEIPSGQFTHFNREMNDLTKGNFKIEILERKVIG
ncbi:MAG: SBDS family ribosome assembly factor [Candidatus Njordarchaeia archaeon]